MSLAPSFSLWQLSGTDMEVMLEHPLRFHCVLSYKANFLSAFLMVQASEPSHLHSCVFEMLAHLYLQHLRTVWFRDKPVGNQYGSLIYPSPSALLLELQLLSQVTF